MSRGCGIGEVPDGGIAGMEEGGFLQWRELRVSAFTSGFPGRPGRGVALPRDWCGGCWSGCSELSPGLEGYRLQK